MADSRQFRPLALLQLSDIRTPAADVRVRAERLWRRPTLLRTFEHQAQCRAMKVMLVFDEAYGEREEHDLGDAFWLVESPSNRTLAERAWKASSTDANSAVFKGGSPVATEDVHGMVDKIDLHHSDWSEIVLIGFDEAEPLTSKLEAEGLSVRPTAAGLSITRRVVYHP